MKRGIVRIGLPFTGLRFLPPLSLVKGEFEDKNSRWSIDRYGNENMARYGFNGLESSTKYTIPLFSIMILDLIRLKEWEGSAMRGLHLRYQLSPSLSLSLSLSCFVQKTKTKTKQNKQTNKQPGPAIIGGNDGIWCRLQGNFPWAPAVLSPNPMTLV